MCQIDEKNSTDEIEITPEMVAAGCSELRLFEDADPPWSIVEAVYTAMEKARQEALHTRHEVERGPFFGPRAQAPNGQKEIR